MKCYLKKFGNKGNATVMPNIVACNDIYDEKVPKLIACDDSDDSDDDEEEKQQQNLNSLKSKTPFDDIRPSNYCSIDDDLHCSEIISAKWNMCSNCTEKSKKSNKSKKNSEYQINFGKIE